MRADDDAVDPVALLKERKGATSLRKFACEVGVSAMHMCDVLKGRRGPGPKILSYLKLTKTVERTVIYRKTR
jgi:hypothetical protein